LRKEVRLPLRGSYRLVKEDETFAFGKGKEEREKKIPKTSGELVRRAEDEMIYLHLMTEGGKTI